MGQSVLHGTLVTSSCLLEEVEWSHFRWIYSSGFLSSSKLILMFYVLSGCFPEFMNPDFDDIFLISFHRIQCKCYFFTFLTTLSSPEGQWASRDTRRVLHTWDRAPRRIGTEFLTHVIMFWFWLCIQILSHSLYIYFTLGVHWMKSPSCN